MSSQDRLENVLRDIHVMISKSEAYDTERIIVKKNDIFDLIDRLNASIYEIMDEYELTQQSRDRALRENKKEGDKIIWDASRQAEDIYAASVLYTEEALNHLHAIVEDANDTIGKLYRDFEVSMQQQQETIRENQLELNSQLQLLTDTEKYLNLIEERNREIERERAKRKGRIVRNKSEYNHKVMKPEIKINEAYFRKAGIPLEQDDKVQTEEEALEPLEDEGVIESTLKKVAMDVRQEVMDEKLTETDDGGLNLSGGDAMLLNQTASPEMIASDVEGLSDSDGETDEQESFMENAVGTPVHRAAPAGIVQSEQPSEVDESVKVNLDAEYFRWKHDESEDIAEEPHHERTSLLDKLMGKKR